jgi:hypothetical protein
VSISPKGFVFFTAAVFTILSTIFGFIYFLGVWTSLKFDWMRPAIPYLQAFAVCALLLWVTALVMDYIAVRRAAIAKPNQPASIDPTPLVEAEKKERIRAVESLAKDHSAAVTRIEQSIRDLNVNLRDHIAAVVPKPIAEPTLKKRTTDLANELFALLKKEGPPPPNPLSQKGGIDEQKRAMKTYFDWQNSTYYQYMAFFRDRVIKTDYELAAVGINTKLTRPELDPLTKEVMENHDVDIKKIAEALLLTANQMSQ